MGGECELDGLGLEAFHNLKIDPLVHLVIEPVIRRFYPVAHIKIQRAVVEITEIYPRRELRVGVDFGNAGENVFDDFDCALRLIMAGVVGDCDICGPPDVRSFSDVFDD